MSEIRIANRYAKSILELAKERNEIGQVSADIEYLKNAFESRELFNLIKSPIINKGKKLDIFSKLFSDNLSHLTNLFLIRVIKKGRESIIPEMVESYHSQYNESEGITAVTLTTTSSISSELLDSIKSKMTSIVGEGKQIILEVKHDDGLIGGYVLEFEDKRYDASVKYKLENIKKSFSA